MERKNEKIEVTKLIDDKLSKESLQIKDLLNTRICFDSYEKYKQEFNLMKNTFKDNITEFYNEAIKCLNKMEEFISKCMSQDDDNVKNYISNNLKKAIYKNSYDSTLDIKSLFIGSLDNSTDKSQSTIIQVSKELGYDNLLRYIELLKSPSLFTSYLNDSEKQIGAMHYLLFKTNHHSNTKFTRNLTTSNLYKLMENDINSSISTILNEKKSLLIL